MYLFEIGLLVILIAFNVILYTFMIPAARSEKMLNWSYSLLNKREKKYCLKALITFFVVLLLLIIFSSKQLNSNYELRDVMLVEQVLEIIGIILLFIFQLYLFYFIYKKFKYKRKMTQENILELERIVMRIVVLFFLATFFGPYLTFICDKILTR